MLAFHSNPLDVLLAEIKDKVEACKAFVAAMEEKCCRSINEQHGDGYREDCIVDDQLSLSLEEPLVHDIADPDGRCGEYSIEDDVLPLVREEASSDAKINLHEEDI